MREGKPAGEGELKKRQGERNRGASVQQRLRNLAKAGGDDVALVLIRYDNERFLYRLTVSPYRDRFILRGATLFVLFDGEPHRATRDIDLLASGELSPAVVQELLKEVCAQSVDPDGVSFLVETIRIEERTEARIYRGLHLEMLTALGTARPRLVIDIAFGEAVTPTPVEADLPVLLEMPAPRLRAYSAETVIAEKCEAMVSLGIANTRMKDFYDLWHLSRSRSFDGALLCQALRATFTRRGTPLPVGGVPVALTAAFGGDPLKQRQWAAFLRKIALKRDATGLPDLIERLCAFLQPPLGALARGSPFALHWSPEGVWRVADAGDAADIGSDRLLG